MTLSNAFINILNDADLNFVVDELEEMTEAELDFVDLSLTMSGMISFIKKDRINVVRDEFKEHKENNDSDCHFYEFVFSDAVRKRHATRTKTGRFFGKFYDEKKAYRISNAYNAVVMQDIEIKETKGFDILDIYLGDNHGESCGTMEDSCMRYYECQEWLAMYAKEPDISILYSTGDGGNIARALLWKLDYNGEKITFMDRIYGTPMVEEVYKLYAKKNGYYYKEHQTYGCNDIMFNGKSIYDFDATFKLKGRYDSYPYMDTLTHLDIDSNELKTQDNCNTYSLDSYEGNYMNECRCGIIGPGMDYVEIENEDWEGHLCEKCMEKYKRCSISLEYYQMDNMWQCQECGRWFHSRYENIHKESNQVFCVTCEAEAIYRPETDVCKECGKKREGYFSNIPFEKTYTIVKVGDYYTYAYLHKDCMIEHSLTTYARPSYVHPSIDTTGYKNIKSSNDLTYAFAYSFDDLFVLDDTTKAITNIR